MQIAGVGQKMGVALVLDGQGKFMAVGTQGKKKPQGRDAIKAFHRQKIIDATIDSIAKYGVVGTTVSRIVEQAGLSRGMINLHFNSKDELFIQTLAYLSDIYTTTWSEALARAADTPADQVMALLEAELSPKILNKKNLPVWIAFRSMARPNPEYIALSSTRNEDVLNTYTTLFGKIIEEGGYTHLHAASIARGVMAMGEGLWIDFMMFPNNFRRESALKTYQMFLSALFPKHFRPPVQVAVVQDEVSLA